MNQAHFHLVVNHFPIILSIVGVLLLLVGLFAKSEVTKRVGYVLFIVSSVFSLIAMNSGEGAEDVIESLNIAEESFMEQHEEAAEVFAVLSYVLGGISIIGLWANWTKKSFANAVLIVAVVIGGITVFYAQKAGTTGGEIRHTEIRSSNAGGVTEGVYTEENDDERRE